MTYWPGVMIVLALAAVVLPLVRFVHTTLADAQIAFAIALVALLIRQIRAALPPRGGDES